MSCNSTPCTNARGQRGPQGQSQFLYIAYASNNAGANFSMTWNQSLTYLQTLVSNTAIANPTAANFTGQWIKFVGNNGAAGAAGADGLDGAVTFRYKWNDGTSATDPGSGYLKINAASTTAATQMYIDNFDGDGNDLSLLLPIAYLSTNAQKSIVIIRKVADPTDFAIYYVTSGANNGGFKTYSLSFISSSAAAPFVLNDEITWSFAQIGDKGNDGSPGKVILNNNISDNNSTGSGSDEVLMTYTIPANTLTTDGSYIYIKAIAENKNSFVTTTDTETVSLKVNSISAFAQTFTSNGERAIIELWITRVSPTVSKIYYVTSNSTVVGSVVAQKWTNATVNTGASANAPMVIQLVARDTVAAPRANYVTANQLLTEKTIL